MKAGMMRDRFELHRPVKMRSATGQQIESWERYDTVWASVTPVSARMKIQASQIVADVSHIGVMRYNANVAHGHRLVRHDGYANKTRTFEITSLTTKREKRREMELMLVETL